MCVTNFDCQGQLCSDSEKMSPTLEKHKSGQGKGGQKQSTSHGARSRAAAKSVALFVNMIFLNENYNWSPKRDG